MLFFLIINLFNISSLQAASTGTLLSFHGDVKLNNKIIHTLQELSVGDTVSTGETAKAVIQLKTMNANGLINPGSQITIENDLIRVHHGTIRWKSSKRKPSRLKVMTQGAVMGVRGTDFISVFSELLNETEIIVFSGNVLFENSSDKKDFKTISSGQWGGIGGRFGKTIGEIISLPDEVLATFGRQTEF